MTRRPGRLASLAVLGVCLALAGPLALPRRAPAAQIAAPNIVLIVTDDQRWDTLWAMPTVSSQLVDRGITFSNGFTVSPLCCPSRASLLTGRYPHSTSVWGNGGPWGGFPRLNDRSTIATWLQDTGYRTALVGKYLNGYPYPSTYIPPGWDRWVAFDGPTAYYRYALNVDGQITYHESGRRDYSTDVLAREAESFIRGTDPGTPLFLLFTPYAPHLRSPPAQRHHRAFPDLEPWRPPSFNEEDVSDKPLYVQSTPYVTDKIDIIRRRQLRALLAVDEAVGRILDALDDTGRTSTTMIVFISDNGFMWGEHRRIDKGVPYEESIRIPYVVRYDPMLAAPRTDRHLVLTIDLAPTFAALAGASPPEVEGQSLLPLLTGAGVPWRTDFAVELYQRALAPPTFCQVRSRRYSYTAYATGEEELYDLRLDPYQLQNLVLDPAYGTILGSMRARAPQLCNPPPPDFTFPAP